MSDSKNVIRAPKEQVLLHLYEIFTDAAGAQKQRPISLVSLVHWDEITVEPCPDNDAHSLLTVRKGDRSRTVRTPAPAERVIEYATAMVEGQAGLSELIRAATAAEERLDPPPRDLRHWTPAYRKLH